MPIKKNPSLTGSENELPLRSELFSADQMERHGKVLAARHRIQEEKTPDQLLPRLADNERALIEACSALTSAIKQNRQNTPAAEWLLDNFYLIEEQIRTAKRHLPKGYSKELPRLVDGPSAGLPRVYDIALETISHGDGRVDPESLSRFVEAYQSVDSLKLGELWAIPIMLRLALIENLRRVAVNIAAARVNRNLADDWADKMIATADKEPSNLILLAADMARSSPLLDNSFVAELVRRLQGQNPGLTLPLTWVSQRLAESGSTIEQVVQSETQQQAADQVSISNSIGSLRFLGSMDWREFVETMSKVEQTLRLDSAAIYSKMDFATRDRYRHVIEGLAKKSTLAEEGIATQALTMSRSGAAIHGVKDVRAHVGYYLVGNGLPALEQAIALREGTLDSIKRHCGNAPLSLYVGSIASLSLIFSALFLFVAYSSGTSDLLIGLMAPIALLAFSHLSVALVNWLVTIFAQPRPLPRLDYSKGIPASARTLVVVPCMLTSTQSIDHLCEALEVRFLANRDVNLKFCLLTDFADAQSETMERDAELVLHVEKCITLLNQTYTNASDESSPFLLLHRPRRWNAEERVWMGYERKRGKLADLNAFLRNQGHQAFSHVIGNIDDLSRTRYVITLDADTQLPRDAACQFISTIAHPLNQAQYDKASRRVTSGYGILQPRVVASLPDSSASRYERLCGGEAGIDPYTRTVSDVYQDLFQEGSFIGKGIYDVDAFEQAVGGQFPENRILSHDLLEGCYTRSGLISDVLLHEDYPSRYSTDVSRRHRWIRGDWQLISWMLSQVPAPPVEGSGKRHSLVANPLSNLSRWKILDNARRSLASPALIVLAALGWSMLNPIWLASFALLVIMFFPALTASVLDVARKPREVLFHQHMLATARTATRHVSHALLNLAFLPHEAFYSLDAICRTVWRTMISHRRMLEWTTSSDANGKSTNDLIGQVRAMWTAPAFAVAVTMLLICLRPLALLPALPILLLWFVSPGVAWWVSLPRIVKRTNLEATQIDYLRHLARKTWAFFETYVGPDDNWLPPDNMQEHPMAAVAHRTSPTNIGLALLANLTALDFGYLCAGQLLERTENTLQSMGKLERHRGHFYNWYDTLTLKPLQPLYVSTVDSGNLAGHLLTLRAGLLLLPDAPIISSRLFAGITDTLKVVLELAPSHLSSALSNLKKELEETDAASYDKLSSLATKLDSLANAALMLAKRTDSEPDKNLIWWTYSLARQCRHAHTDLLLLAPWLSLTCIENLSIEIPALNQVSSLRALAQLETNVHSLIAERMAASNGSTQVRANWVSLSALLATGCRHAVERMSQITRIAVELVAFADMEYDFLYDDPSHLLTIGYNVNERRCDSGSYDLLASEARLCCFVAIAQGKLPQEAWFALGRQLTVAGGEPILLSWSGSMFEYLMPLLVMPNYENTLLDQTYKSAVQRQIEYGAQRDVPWGVSESGYYAFDAALNYQYRAFGVPGLGLKRGLGDELVVAPYATVMALMVKPDAACANLQRLSADGFEGKLGMHEAIDYTTMRLPRGQTQALIRSYMAHHQGMSFLSLAYYLLDQPMQKRFESDPLFQATLLLLKERVPKPTSFYSNTTELADVRSAANTQEMPTRILTRVDTRTPEVQLLSNGRYHVMITNAGGGSSRWRDLSVTRWREDSTCDNWGSFCYIRDLSDNSYWSTSYQPTLTSPRHQEVIFTEGRAEFRRRGNDFDTYTEIVVSPEDDIELRRTRITNRSRVSKTIDVTSYAEVVMAPYNADIAHPAFSKLFVQTEILPQQDAILCTRRAGSDHESTPTMFHLMAIHGTDSGGVTFETDRMKFIGRGNTARAPRAMEQAQLSGSAGSVLDPIVAIRHQITLAPEQTVIVDVVTGVSETRDGALGLVSKYHDLHLADRVFELAWTHNQVVLRQLNAGEADALLYGRLAGTVVYANAQLRADASVLIKNRRGQSGLWSYAISGDLPIILLQISDAQNIELVRQIVQAHAYWRMKGLAVDLVIWNEDHAGYRQALQDQIMSLIASGIDAHVMDRPGGIFVRLADQIPNEDRILIQSVARAIISDTRGTLAEQINRQGRTEVRMPALVVTAPKPAATIEDTSGTPEKLTFFNGLGGFAEDGREYVMSTGKGNMTPVPWANVLANAHFGTVISESGQSYTWGENAHEFRLTPWSNDPVSDGGGEVFYVRDEESGHFWSPTQLPRAGSGKYLARHGFGYSVFEHVEDGIRTTLTVYVALDASIKFSVLKVENESSRPRKLSATGYVEWVLGDLRQKSAMHIATEADPATGALFAKNSYNTEFPDRIAFFHVDASNCSFTGDRTEFIGRNGSLENPAALGRTRLSGRVGTGFDPCAAILIPFDLEQGDTREFVFMLGVTGRRSADVSGLIQRFKGADAAREALASIEAHWQRTLGAVQVETPDLALNIMANGWLMYQTMACRIWARSGFYQSGGAFGFRDQLQDTMALLHTRPDMMREHLLLFAAHQFVEGDVQHWWHPPADRGVRTHCSDDYLWLPLATCRYVVGTGDISILDESVHFLEGRLVNPDEESYYDLPGHSKESATLYDHCVRAILHGLRVGVHGLPLIGSCDWNDGMNEIGSGGKGESVWLAFFQIEVMKSFARIASARGDAEFAERCRREVATLDANVEKNAWDGAWYRRAYFDDGTPLGSSENQECRIDSISQSWSVLSGAGSPERAKLAMQALDQHLVKREQDLVQLLDPPFDKAKPSPGYIKGYAPGVRENGGQYTHAAVWAAMAFAKMGDKERAWELFHIINPVNHGRTAQDIDTYKVEPYVLAADVYAVAPHIGRGGWTWYTGSAGWMYRFIVESLLGLTLEGNTLSVKPCLPPDWTRFALRYRYKNTSYRIVVVQQGNSSDAKVTVDGTLRQQSNIILEDDGKEHAVEIVVSSTATS